MFVEGFARSVDVIHSINIRLTVALIPNPPTSFVEPKEKKVTAHMSLHYRLASNRLRTCRDPPLHICQGPQSSHWATMTCMRPQQRLTSHFSLQM